MELAHSLILLVGVWLGYRMGKGEVINFIPKSFKPIIRTPESEQKLIDKIKGVK